MRFEWLLLAAVPGALGRVFHYKPPTNSSHVESRASSCDMPSGFAVRHFHGKSDSAKMSSYHFTFMDTSTNCTTRCEFSQDSVPVHSDEAGHRYACHDKRVHFQWDENHNSMWVGEEVCSDAKGKPSYVASGAANMAVSCLAKTGTCSSKSHNVHGLFTTMKPVH